MRQFIFSIIVCFLLTNYSFSQTNFPPFLNKEEQQLKYKITSFNSGMEKYDSLAKNILNSLNSTRPYEITGSIGVNNIEDIKNSFGTISLGARFRVSKYKARPADSPKGIRRLDPHYIYFEYKTRTTLSNDTNTLAKTFVFPQLNKQDYVFGYYNQITNGNNWDFWLPIFEFSLNKYSDKENKNYFTSEVFQLGVRVHKSFTNTTDTGHRWVMFMPYYKLIKIDPKHKTSYNLLLGETSLPSMFHAVGMEMAFGTQNASFFCNMNYILNKDDEIKSPELIGFVYTVGLRALFSSNSFRIF
ncbi:MAG: hypothetical protein QM763_19150 [Agriterribacter sp.]